ncbi:IclR family transcriptional regulator [Streptomyces sp. NPDC056390]|uniref:IclR family transcriptional regulator n=1 Tax=Streptomyces sp. NPDC056390 TaxID=3345806 RepID=UPI0035DA4CB0
MKPEKTQVVARVTAILAEVARHGAQGARLLDLAHETGIARPTVHRILQDLAEAGFVEQRSDKRYGLGPALYMLGLSAPSPVRDLAGIEKTARRLAGQTEDTVYVAIRRPDGVHYLLRAEGSYPIRAYFVEAGETVPLGVTYAGIALLSWHAPEAIDAQLLVHEPLRRLMGAATLDGDTVAAAVRRQVAEIRERGYCFDTDTVMPGVSGMAAPIPSRSSDPYMAITITAINDRLPPQRVSELGPLLLTAAQDIAEFIQ